MKKLLHHAVFYNTLKLMKLSIMQLQVCFKVVTKIRTECEQCLHFLNTAHNAELVMVKQFHYRTGQAHRVPGGWGSQIFTQSAHEGARLSAIRLSAFTPQEIFLVLIYVRGWVDPRAIVRPTGLCQWKNPLTPSGIEPATCRFVPQCPNCATAAPCWTSARV
jgi:hypothetical protein